MLTTTSRAIGKVLGTLALVAALALAAMFLVLPRITGGAALSVLTGSMTPTIPAGSLVLVVPQDPQTVRPGDVITFQTAPGVAEYVTHRVVKVQRNTEPMTFITKGDANKGIDVDPVPLGAVRGVVRFHLPYLGDAADFVRTPAGLVMLGAAAGSLVILALVRSIVAELRKGRAGDDLALAVGEGSVPAP